MRQKDLWDTSPTPQKFTPQVGKQKANSVQCEGELKCGPNVTFTSHQHRSSLTKRTSKRGWIFKDGYYIFRKTAGKEKANRGDGCSQTWRYDSAECIWMVTWMVTWPSSQMPGGDGGADAESMGENPLKGLV